MAQRQFACTALKQAWSYLHFTKFVPQVQVKNGPMALVASNAMKPKSPSFTVKGVSLLEGSTSSIYQASEKNKTFIDLFTNNLHKRLYMPTISINKLKVYEDIASPKCIQDPLINNVKIIDAPVPGRPEKKEAVRMILIRRRKMRKHKLRKLRKRMKFVFAKVKLRRQLRKEQTFRTELLSQIEIADNFDAKAYVENILHTIRYQRKPETIEECRERYRLLRKMNKYNTTFIRPNFDD